MSRPDLLECYVLDKTTPLYCKISWKSPAHILEHHLWNPLVNKSILAFIPHFSPFFCAGVDGQNWSLVTVNYKFDGLKLNHVTRKYNEEADELAKIASGQTTIPRTSSPAT